MDRNAIIAELVSAALTSQGMINVESAVEVLGDRAQLTVTYGGVIRGRHTIVITQALDTRVCPWCDMGEDAGPLHPALGTGDSYHTGCVTPATYAIYRARALVAGIHPVPAGSPVPDGIGADAEPGDLQ